MSLTLQYDPDSKKKFLAEFTNGSLVDKSQFSCKLLQINEANDEQVLYVKGDTINYLGDNFSERSRQPYACKYALAKINKKTKKAKVYDVNLFKLKPVLKECKTVIGSGSSGRKKTYREKQIELLSTFGSKFVRKNEKLAQAIDVTSMDDVIKVMNKPDFVLPDEKQEAVLPKLLIPHNTEAMCVKELYPLYDIIPQDVLLSEANNAKKFMQPSAEDFETWKNATGAINSQYVQDHIRHLNMLNDEDAFESFLILQVIIYLIDLGNLQKGGKRKESLKNAPKIGSIMENWVKETFFDSTKSVYRQQMVSRNNKDIMHATVILLAWHIDGFSMSWKSIRSCISISTLRFLKIVEALGGVVNRNQVKLKYPLSIVDERIKPAPVRPTHSSLLKSH